MPLRQTIVKFGLLGVKERGGGINLMQSFGQPGSEGGDDTSLQLMLLAPIKTKLENFFSFTSCRLIIMTLPH